MPRRLTIEVARHEELAKQALERAYLLLSDKRRWTRGTVARDGQGRGVVVYSPAAEQWCAVGAIDRAAWDVCREAGFDKDAGAVVRYVRDAAHRRIKPVMQDVAQTVTPKQASYIKTADLPQFNDNGTWGYPVVIAAFAQVTGRGVTDAIARSIERVRRLREAALKGWATRRANEKALWDAEWEARKRTFQPPEAAPTPAMTFGGTVNPVPSAEPERVTA